MDESVQFPTIASLVAGIFAVMLVLLSFQISLRRARLNVTYGDGGDEALRRRVRAHGNFIEYAPMAIVVLALVELAGPPHWVVVTMAAGFVTSRLLHAVGMLYTSGPALRATGMLLQHVTFLGGAAVLLRCFLVIV